MNMVSVLAATLGLCMALSSVCCLAGSPDDARMLARRALLAKTKVPPPEKVCATDMKSGKRITFASAAKAQTAKAFVLFRGPCAAVFPFVRDFNCQCKFSRRNVCATSSETGITTTLNDACTAGCEGYTILYDDVCKNPGSVKGKDCDCGDIVSPVCATPKGKNSKKKTYANLCLASCSDATDYTPGACKVPPPEKVCAKDLKTGKRSTFASAAAAEKAKKFVLFRGACTGIFPVIDKSNCQCKFSFNTVCATDPKSGITQSLNDACTANCDGSIILYYDACKNPGSVKGKVCDCGDIVSPVCATPKGKNSKNKTYASLCLASCSGATKYTPGKCKA